MDDTRNTSKRLLLASLGVVAIVLSLVGGLYLLIGGRGGRPVPVPKTVSFSGAEKEPGESLKGEMLTLQPEQLRNAAIASEEVAEGVVDGTSGAVTGSGILQTNAYKDVRVTAQVRGVIRSLTVDPGVVVRKGQLIGSAESDEFVKAQTEYLTSRIDADNARRAYERALALADVNPSSKNEYDAAVRTSIASIAAFEEAKSRVERARKLAGIGAISTETLDAETTRFKSAEAEAAEAKARLERARKLLEISPEARSQTEEAMSRLSNASGQRVAARQRLTLIGLSSEDVNILERTGNPLNALPLRSPIDGILISRGIAIGEIFESGRELFRVADNTELWFVAQVFDKDLGSMKKGTVVEVSVAGSAKIIKGVVQLVEPVVNETTRTNQVRILIAKPGSELRIGSFASLLKIVGEASSGLRRVVVKSDAVQRVGDSSYVFIPQPDGLSFELRPVRTGNPSEGLTPILEGLSKGERVVTEGAFLLKAELVKRHQN